MTLSCKTATVFGGTGFIGTQIVRTLAKLGWRVKVASRVPERAFFLRPCGTVGQIVPVACDYTPESIAAAVKGSDFVVNCIGILYERGKAKFKKIHADIPQTIAGACAAQGVERFVHISALACERGTSRYARSKFAGEQAVRAAFPKATILRPSLVFGPEDDFFNKFAELARFLPVFPLIGGGKTLFQPVYAGDVAAAVAAALTLPAAGDKNPEGGIYELAGPERLSFRQIYERLFEETGRARCLLSLPFPLAKVQGAFMALAPSPLLTPDQVESLKTDNIPSGAERTLEDLGIQPTGMAAILPAYLARFRPDGDIRRRA